MEQEVLVQVEGLSKKFCKSLKKSLRYGVQDLVGSVVGKKPTDTLRKDEFWALRDINFELRRGECLGLIGHNGAGKSTLLKILNGLINPDEGKVTLRGRVGALIELGAGFNPILSGRENIYNNGAVLGFTKAEIDHKVEDIIDFAEIREFIDMPVQNYSSGMKVRLGFAVAAQMEPDVLIIDEVLAVGDMGFRAKCLSKMASIMENCAIIFVSHSMPLIARTSNRILLMDRGLVVINSLDVSKGIGKFYENFESVTGVNTVHGTKRIILNSFSINHIENPDIFEIDYNDKINIALDLCVDKSVTKYFVSIAFIDSETKIVANLFSSISDNIFSNKGNTKIEVFLDHILLGLGLYKISVSINQVLLNGTRGEIYYHNQNVSKLRVKNVTSAIAPVQFYGHWNEKLNE